MFIHHLECSDHLLCGRYTQSLDDGQNPKSRDHNDDTDSTMCTEFSAIVGIDTEDHVPFAKSTVRPCT